MISATIIIVLAHMVHRSPGTRGSEAYQGTLPWSVKISKMLKEGTTQDPSVGQVSCNGGIMTYHHYFIHLIKRCFSNKMLFLILNNYLLFTAIGNKFQTSLHARFVSDMYDRVINRRLSSIKIHYIRVKFCGGSEMEI